MTSYEEIRKETERDIKIADFLTLLIILPTYTYVAVLLFSTMEPLEALFYFCLWVVPLPLIYRIFHCIFFFFIIVFVALIKEKEEW